MEVQEWLINVIYWELPISTLFLNKYEYVFKLGHHCNQCSLFFFLNPPIVIIPVNSSPYKETSMF